MSLDDYEPYFRLEGREAVPCDHVFWRDWIKSADLRVKLDRIGGVCVSTVFLGINYNFSGEGDPILFETVVMSEVELIDMPSLNIRQRRYSTWTEAEAGHNATVERLRAVLPLV